MSMVNVCPVIFQYNCTYISGKGKKGFALLSYTPVIEGIKGHYLLSLSNDTSMLTIGNIEIK